MLLGLKCQVNMEQCNWSEINFNQNYQILDISVNSLTSYSIYSAQNYQPGSHIYNRLPNPLFGNPESRLLPSSDLFFAAASLAAVAMRRGRRGQLLGAKDWAAGVLPQEGSGRESAWPSSSRCRTGKPRSPSCPRHLKEPQRDRKKTKNIKRNGSISLDDVVEIARVMRPRSVAKDLAGTVKEILGNCVSVALTSRTRLATTTSRYPSSELRRHCYYWFVSSLHPKSSLVLSFWVASVGNISCSETMQNLWVQFECNIVALWVTYAFMYACVNISCFCNQS